MQVGDSDSNINNIFQCPEDSITVSQDDHIRRSFSRNSGPSAWNGVSFGANNAEQIELTQVKYSEIDNPSSVMITSEKAIDLNRLGRKGQSRLFNPSNQYEGGVLNLHGSYKYNYTFVDGAVKNMTIYAGVGTGDINNPLGMWTRVSGD
jgi:hypothetical protein